MYRNTLIGLCLSILSISPVSAQEVVLEGRAFIHNSQYRTGDLQYLSNVFVSAPYAGSDDTDDQGWFDLAFVGMDRGTSVALTVEKSGWEVVNERDLTDVVIGRRTPLRVYLARKGAIAKAKTELYEVSLKALTARHRKMIAQLRKEGAEQQAAIEELEAKLNREISNRFEAEELLNEQLAATKRRLPQFAKQLATVNLDFASEMYRRAYAYFEKGEIEKAIEALDEAVLDRQAKETVANMDSLKQEISRSETAKSFNLYTLDTLAQSTLLKARLHRENGELTTALQYYRQALNTLYKLEDQVAPITDAYGAMGAIFQQLDQLDSALFYQRKRLAGLQKTTPPNLSAQVETCEQIAALYDTLAQPDQAIPYRLRAYGIRQQYLPDGDQALTAAAQRLQPQMLARAQQLEARQDYEAALALYEQMQELPLDKKQARRLRRKVRKLRRKTH